MELGLHYINGETEPQSGCLHNFSATELLKTPGISNLVLQSEDGSSYLSSESGFWLVPHLISSHTPCGPRPSSWFFFQKVIEIQRDWGDLLMATGKFGIKTQGH